MRANEYPMKSNLFKNFDNAEIVRYGDLTEEEQGYEVVDVVLRGINPVSNGYKVVVIASPETMKLFNLKPFVFQTGKRR